MAIREEKQIQLIQISKEEIPNFLQGKFLENYNNNN